MSKRKRTNGFFKLRSLYVWHRHIGVFAAIFVMLLSISGFMLNHSDELALDQQYIQSGFILDQYGIGAPETATHVVDCWQPISQLGEVLFFAGQQLDGKYQPVKGAIKIQDICAVLTENQLLLLTDTGEVLDLLGVEQGLPRLPEKIGLNAQRQVIITASQQNYSVDKNWLNIALLKTPSGPVVWSSSQQPSSLEIKNLQSIYRSKILTQERFVQDFHSGRLFGKFGVWVVDLVALLLILLACSGVFLWWRQLSKKRRGKKRRHQGRY